MSQRLYSTLPVAWQLGFDTRELLYGWLCPPYRVSRKSNVELDNRLVETVYRSWVKAFAPSNLPTMILLVGKCRVGSTALANVFGHCGLTTYYQPLKALLRNEMANRSGVLPDLPRGASVFCIKETFGPYTLVESTFDPLSILLSAGWPVDKISVVLLERKPDDTLSSWIRNWSSKISSDALERHFVIASLQRLQIERECAENNVRNVLHRYETKNAVQSIKKLFVAIGFPELFTSRSLSGWQFTSSLNGSIDKVIFPDEPSVFEVANLHSSCQKFDLRAEGQVKLPLTSLDLIESFHLRKLYLTDLQTVNLHGESALA